MPQIRIPSPLRQYAGKQASLEVPARTVGEALAGLIAQHPDLRHHLYADNGKLRAFVNVYVNDEDMRYLQKEATALKETDTISIVPSIAGGISDCGFLIVDLRLNAGFADEHHCGMQLSNVVPFHRLLIHAAENRQS